MPVGRPAPDLLKAARRRGAAGHIQFARRRRWTVEALHAGAVVALAGEAAQRQFSPRSVRHHQGEGDRATVAEAALQATGSAEQADLLVKFWTVGAQDLVAQRWDAVNQVAVALLERDRLTYAEVLALAMNQPEAPLPSPRQMPSGAAFEAAVVT